MIPERGAPLSLPLSSLRGTFLLVPLPSSPSVVTSPSVIRRVSPARVAAVTVGLGAGGAVAGAILLPLSSWTFLRRIPLGRVLLTLALGGAAGAALGLAPTVLTSNFTWAFGGALAGLGGAVAWLRGHLPRRR